MAELDQATGGSQAAQADQVAASVDSLYAKTATAQ